MQSGPDGLIAAARIEGRALRARFNDPRTRVWVWLRSPTGSGGQQLQAVLTPECQEPWGRMVFNDAHPIALDYLPRSEGWWAEYRLRRRLAELDQILERLDAPPDPGAFEPGAGPPGPMDGGVDASSTRTAGEDTG